MMMSGDCESDKDVLVFRRKNDEEKSENNIHKPRNLEDDDVRDISCEETSKLIVIEEEVDRCDSCCYYFYCVML